MEILTSREKHMYAGIVKNAKTAWVTLLIGVAVIIGLFALPVEENDTTILKDYFVFGIPHKLLIDRDGVIIGKWKGGGLNNKHSLQQLLGKTMDR